VKPLGTFGNSVMQPIQGRQLGYDVTATSGLVLAGHLPRTLTRVMA
jgi:hypothetical protein